MKTLKPSPFQRLKRLQKKNLHDQLDAYLAAPDTPPPGYDGITWTTLDSLCLVQLEGGGVALSVHTRLPETEGHVQEDPQVTAVENQPKPLIEVVE